MMSSRNAVRLCGCAAVLVLAASVIPAVFPDRVAPPYPLKELDPKGFNVYEGILDAVPVSAASSVAFAINTSSSGGLGSLMSMQLSKTGVLSSAKAFASAVGEARNAAALWISPSGSESDGAAGYGIVYALFSRKYTNPTRCLVSVQAAKFNAAGLRTSSWKTVWTMTTPNGTYPAATRLFAHNKGDRIGVVFSLAILEDITWQVRKSVAYFVEANVQTGAPNRSPAPINVRGDGSYIYSWLFRPVWNGSFWLVPVANKVYKSPGKVSDLQMTEALLFSVSPIPPHYSGCTVIDYSTNVNVWYDDLWPAPYAGSTSDYWLLVKKLEAIPKAQRRLDMYRYSFGLKRIDWSGAVVQTKKLALGNLVHQLAYDPAYVFQGEQDYFTPFVATDSTGTPQLFISRLHALTLYKKNVSVPPRRYEQQFLLYAINASTGAATWKNWSVTVWSDTDTGGLGKPRLFVFPGDTLAAINNLRTMTEPYENRSMLSTFPDWLK